MTVQRRRWLIVLAIVFVVSAGLCFLDPWNPITERNWERIQIGMTEDQVVAILGPPGQASGIRGRFTHNWGTILHPPAWRIWDCYNVRIVVDIDPATGRVRRKSYIKGQYPPSVHRDEP